MTVVERSKSGVFSCQELERAIARGVISSDVKIAEAQIQPASLDLRLGGKAYRLVSSFLPDKKQKVFNIFTSGKMIMYEHELTDEGMVLEKNCVYLIPLMERLDLPPDVGGKANPKSTTGRLDIFTRVITDRNPRFDEIPTEYKGELFLEVMPRSFTVKVRKGQSLVQLRLRENRESCRVTGKQLKELNKKTPLLYDGDRPVPLSKGNLSSGMLYMSVDLKGGEDGIIGYKSKRNSQVVDLKEKNYYNMEEFWEPIKRNSKENTLILEPEEFYILGSKESISIPVGCAADMAPYEAGSGELRTHYAGFFDPGFGYGTDGELKGTKAVLEVRAHDVPFMLAHGQSFCNLYFEKMSEVPEKVYGPKIGSSYQYQGIALSKQFKGKE
ncbi:MAG: 2'-deoxycytidine 5'-triphosphate deaminase [Thermodesulfobacteriota bacterium]